MAKVLIEETTLTAIGDAIRGKEGTTDLVPVSDMATRINALSGGADFYEELVQGKVTEVLPTDFNEGITKLKGYTFSFCPNLTSVTLPDQIESLGTYMFYQSSKVTRCVLSKNLKNLDNQCFTGANHVTSLTFYGPPPTIQENTFEASQKTFYVPGRYLDDYYNAKWWGGVFKDRLVPNSPYVSVPSSKILAFNGSTVVKIPLMAFEELPEPTITALDDALSISDISCTLEEISFTVTAGNTEGEHTIQITVPGEDEFVFERQLTVKVFAELAPSTWEVVPVDGATYGFTLGDDGYWASTNQKKASTYSMCRVNISNPVGYNVIVEGISWGESNYDFAILSNVNQSLALNANVDSTYHFNFKGLATIAAAAARDIVYTDAVGDCFITIKYKKDGSGDHGDDTFKFKIRFEG